MLKRKKSGRLSGFGKMLYLVLFVLCLSMATAPLTHVRAEAKTTSKAKTSKAKKNKNRWVRKHLYYFYVKNGKRTRGFKKIGSKYYYFDSKGIQLTGWRKIGSKYRYFRIRNGKDGYMLRGKTVNGVVLDKKGAAVVTAETEKKLELLTQYQALADTLVRPGMAKQQKLVTVFKYARDKNYRSIGSPAPVGRWDERLAEDFLYENWADCTMAATGFAYLANAVGFSKVSVRLYGHGHCEINRLIYDPGFAKTVPDEEYTKYFAKTYAELEAWYTSDDTPTRFI